MGGPLDRHAGIGDPQSTVGDDWWAWSDSRAIRRAHASGVAVATRVLPEGRRDAAIRRWRLGIHRGNRVECNICGSRFRHFMARWNSPNVICWRCGSHERHRTLWAFLETQRPELLAGVRSLLHFAPEPGLEALLRARVTRYVSSDLQQDLGELTLDLTALDLPDSSFDATICSHVLEHVPDDAAAMSELWRILVPGGWAVVMVPIDPARSATLEDTGITDPAERRRLLWQEDHMRLYAYDVVGRLERAGFEVEHVRPTEAMSDRQIERLRLGLGNDVFVCRRPAYPSGVESSGAGTRRAGRER